MNLLLSVFLQVLVLLVVVPACTGGNVAIRHGGFFRGLLVLICISLTNIILSFGLIILTVGMTVVLQWLTFGLLGLLINALAIRITAGVLKDVLYVRNFWSALGAALVIVLANAAIHRCLF